MCSSHLSSSIAMLYHRWVSPSLFSLVCVLFSPVVGLVVVVSVVKMCGTIDFLFVTMTPPIGRGLFVNAVRSCFAGFGIGPRTSFPRYVIDRITTRSSAAGKLKNVFRIEAFFT